MSLIRKKKTPAKTSCHTVVNFHVLRSALQFSACKIYCVYPWNTHFLKCYNYDSWGSPIKRGGKCSPSWSSGVNSRFWSFRLFRTESQQFYLSRFSIITSMIMENRVLWYWVGALLHPTHNHHAVIITLKVSSFQNVSQICWCFGVGNWSIILFSRIIISVSILKQLVASGYVNIGE